MNPKMYNTVLLIMSLIMCAFIAVAASVQSEHRMEIQRSLDSECKTLANGHDFIANTNGCYIKHE